MASAGRPRAALCAGLLTLCLTVGLTACSSTPPTPHPSSSSTTTSASNAFEQQRRDGVNALLGKLRDALQSGNGAALDALIDPLATPAFRASLHIAQKNLTQKNPTQKTASTAPAPAGRGGPLVLRTLAFQVGSEQVSERLIGGALAVKLSDAGSSDSWVTPVNVQYALGGQSTPGVDEPDVTLSETMAFSRYDDAWKLLGDGSLAGDTSDPNEPQRPPEVPPWTYDGLRAAQVDSAGGRSAVLSYPDTDTTVGYIRRQLAPGIEAVSDFWGKDWPQTAVVVVTGDEDQFAGLTRTAEGDTEAAAAATVFSTINRSTQTVVGQRVVFSPAAAQLSEAGIAVVLRHELFHAASRLITADKTPKWLTEGVAEYVGRRGTKPDFNDVAPDLAVQVASGEKTTLPKDKDFSVDTDQARLAYQTAWSFAAYIAGKYGDPKLRAMYAAAAPTVTDDTTKAAVKSSLGVDYDTLIRDWQAWLSRQVR
ncbi:MAG: hypothetical protein QM774_05930 [Gordonia sp. (in: high G+C Gram-positive bacteria)]|uniref:peptidase MA family metallohydrolase n=1 Tax=Gordonia sp. (in: high G+C Gram-positive bacteria) TaxID=84139 RepID=UPI0039E49B36